MSTRRWIRWTWVAALLLAAPALAAAQTTSPSQPQDRRRLWILAGGSATTVLGDCTGCAADTYRHTGGVFGTIGAALNRRTDVGVELFWVPSEATVADPVRTTSVLGSIQVRPWASKGFFLRAGIGIAFVRSWIIAPDDANLPVVTSKAFALDLATGWEWRLKGRFGAQVFGAQHVAALGDLPTSAGTFENVMANYWSVGAAIVIR